MEFCHFTVCFSSQPSDRTSIRCRFKRNSLDQIVAGLMPYCCCGSRLKAIGAGCHSKWREAGRLMAVRQRLRHRDSDYVSTTNQPTILQLSNGLRKLAATIFYWKGRVKKQKDMQNQSLKVKLQSCLSIFPDSLVSNYGNLFFQLSSSLKVLNGSKVK